VHNTVQLQPVSCFFRESFFESPPPPRLLVALSFLLGHVFPQSILGGKANVSFRFVGGPLLKCELQRLVCSEYELGVFAVSEPSLTPGTMLLTPGTMLLTPGKAS
jgi:hypothetical protein